MLYILIAIIVEVKINKPSPNKIKRLITSHPICSIYLHKIVSSDSLQFKMQANKNLYYANIYIFLSNIFKPDQACFHPFKKIYRKIYIHRRVNTLFSFPLNLVCKGRRFFIYLLKCHLRRCLYSLLKTTKGYRKY